MLAAIICFIIEFFYLYEIPLTSSVTSCLAIALSTASYICVFWIPSPQKIAKASRNCSSFLLKAFTSPEASSILLTNWQTPAFRGHKKNYIAQGCSYFCGHIIKIEQG